MKKLVVFLSVLVVILIVAVIGLYSYVIQANKGNLEAIFSGMEWNSELRARIEVLEDKVEALETKTENTNN